VISGSCRCCCSDAVIYHTAIVCCGASQPFFPAHRLHHTLECHYLFPTLSDSKDTFQIICDDTSARLDNNWNYIIYICQKINIPKFESANLLSLFPTKHLNSPLAEFHVVGILWSILIPQPFYGLFSGTTQVSQGQKRTSGLYGAREE